MLIHLVALILVFYFPVTQLLFFAREKERLLTVPHTRPAFYRNTTIMLWAAAGMLALVLTLEEVSWQQMGFSMEWSWRFVSVSALVTVLSILFVLGATVTAENYQKLQAGYAHVRFSLPHNPREFRSLCTTAVTAGITEEFIYRAFLFWYFAQFVNVIAALMLANIAFCLGHIWSGPKNMAGAFMLGMGFSAIYLASGSLLPAMLAHAAVDIYGGRVGLGLAEFEESATEGAIMNEDRPGNTR